MGSAVIVYVSGNLANVYFNLYAGKVNRETLDTAPPGLLDTLLHHEGISLVAT